MIISYRILLPRRYSFILDSSHERRIWLSRRCSIQLDVFLDLRWGSGSRRGGWHQSNIVRGNTNRRVLKHYIIKSNKLQWLHLWHNLPECELLLVSFSSDCHSWRWPDEEYCQPLRIQSKNETNEETNSTFYILSTYHIFNVTVEGREVSASRSPSSPLWFALFLGFSEPKTRSRAGVRIRGDHVGRNYVGNCTTRCRWSFWTGRDRNLLALKTKNCINNKGTL